MESAYSDIFDFRWKGLLKQSSETFSLYVFPDNLQEERPREQVSSLQLREGRKCTGKESRVSKGIQKVIAFYTYQCHTRCITDQQSSPFLPSPIFRVRSFTPLAKPAPDVLEGHLAQGPSQDFAVRRSKWFSNMIDLTNIHEYMS